MALKELPLAEVMGKAFTEAERNASVLNMGKEVDILSSLNHPNIVQARFGVCKILFASNPLCLNHPNIVQARFCVWRLHPPTAKSSKPQILNLPKISL